MAEAVASGEATPDGLLDAALDARRGAATPRSTPWSSCRRRRRGARSATGLPRGPFRGVPFLLKDLGAEAVGFPSHGGSRLFARRHGAGRLRPSCARLPRGGARDLRAHHRARERHRPGHRGRRLRRPHAQPLGPRAHARRLVGRGGGGGGGGDRAGGARLGRRRLGAHPGLELRALRVQGVARAASPTAPTRARAGAAWPSTASSPARSATRPRCMDACEGAGPRRALPRAAARARATWRPSPGRRGACGSGSATPTFDGPPVHPDCAEAVARGGPAPRVARPPRRARCAPRPTTRA